MSLLDEPIDVPEEADDWSDDIGEANGPPPYQQPPAYCNTQEAADDPFDTSKVYSPAGLENVNSVIKMKNTNLIAASVVNQQKNEVLSVDETVHSPHKSVLDKRLLEELEGLSLSKEGTQIPLLQPPPSSSKIKQSTVKNSNLTAVAKTLNRDDHMMSLNEYISKNSSADTSSVFNKIWYHNAVVQNGNMPKVNNTPNEENISEFGQFRCNQPVSFSGHQNGDATLYNNQSVSAYYGTTGSCNVYASQMATYGSYNSLPGYRQYSEVAQDSLYSEIPEYLYSPVPDETLRPHRPAPPSPLVLVGQPQSMQQIQRKIQQGQVKFWFVLKFV